MTEFKPGDRVMVRGSDYQPVLGTVIPPDHPFAVGLERQNRVEADTVLVQLDDPDQSDREPWEAGGYIAYPEPLPEIARFAICQAGEVRHAVPVADAQEDGE